MDLSVPNSRVVGSVCPQALVAGHSTELHEQLRAFTVQRRMKEHLCGWLLFVAALNLAAEDHGYLRDYANTTNGVSLTAGFIPDASRIVLGEPLFLTFVLSNRAAQPFQFSQVRTEIFTITATNAAGAPARDLHNHMMDGNGFGREVVVPPGQVHTQRLFNDWCGFDAPGEYNVTCSCFGWFQNQSKLGRPIVTTFKLTVLPADPKRLTEIIDAWAQAVQTNGPLYEVAQALTSIHDPRTIPSLALLVTKDSQVNYLAVRALARFTNELAAADALTLALKTGEDYVAQIAGKALRDFHQADRAALSLLPALTHPDAHVRIQTARAVSWTGSEHAFAPLCTLLDDTTNTVRYAAAEAIGRLGDARSFAVLTNCLSHADFALRLAAVRGLLALGRPLQPAWVTPMILGGGENVRTFYDAIDLLRLRGGDKAAPGLASCLRFDDPSVRHGYNFRLILALEFSPNGPKHYYQWHHDPNRDGTEQELADNRKILTEIKSWLDKQRLQ